MSASSVPIPAASPALHGRALVIGNDGCREVPGRVLRQAGFAPDDAGDPYSALAILCQRPAAYGALVVSLASVYREEVQVIATVKRCFPHVAVYLAHTDGRPGALADALRHGADGLLSDEGLHRFDAEPHRAPSPVAPPPAAVQPAAPLAGGRPATPPGVASSPWPQPREPEAMPVRVERPSIPLSRVEMAQPRPQPVAPAAASPTPAPRPAPAAEAGPEPDRRGVDLPAAGEPILTAEELRALLQEPVRPPAAVDVE